MNEKILQVQNLETVFFSNGKKIQAVNGVSFDVFKGKTLGIVGESGSGKSVTALSLLQLIPNPPGKIMGGKAIFNGKDLLQNNELEMQKIRGNRIAMIFQEPMTSLNPVFTIGNQIIEVLKLHQNYSSREAYIKAIKLLEQVGIPSPEIRVDEYPHQLSGGMRQRVMIAMALACDPDILIADEPTTALDVTIQAQILDLMINLQEKCGMGIILITHDLGVVAEVCHEVCVMYCGNIVEKASVQSLFKNPQHPYTKGLMDSIPTYDSSNDQIKKRLVTIEGMVPSLANLPDGCNFQNRCAHKTSECSKRGYVPLLEKRKGCLEDQTVACFHPLQ